MTLERLWHIGNLKYFFKINVLACFLEVKQAKKSSKVTGNTRTIGLSFILFFLFPSHMTISHDIISNLLF